MTDWGQVWYSTKEWGKILFFVIMFIVFPILTICVETNYIQPNDNTYHIYEDCAKVRNKKQLRKVKRKEIKQRGYTMCKYCKSRKDTHDAEELEYWNNYDAQLY